MRQDYDELNLIRAAQKGDREAFSRLYEANVDRVYRYLLGRVGQPADAEDVAAEVFIRAIEALPSYQDKGVPIIAWLLKIAHNTSVNHVKKQYRRRELPLFDNSRISDDPADEAVANLTSGEVAEAMASLTDLQRRVISLRYVEQRSISETAREMDRSESAVKFLQHSAVRALRRILRPREAEGSAR